MYVENHSLGEWFQRRLVPMMKREKNSFCCKINLRSGNCKGQQKEDIKMIDIKQSLAHTTWNCKYHIVLPTVISITQGFTSILKAKS